MTDNLQKNMLVIVQLLLPGCSSFQLLSKHSLVSEYLSIPFRICRTSPLTHELPLLQLVMPSLECLTLALYSPSLASSSLSSHTLERSEYCVARVYCVCILYTYVGTPYGDNSMKSLYGDSLIWQLGYSTYVHSANNKIL